jgi:hypothetical protein
MDRLLITMGMVMGIMPENEDRFSLRVGMRMIHGVTIPLIVAFLALAGL